MCTDLYSARAACALFLCQTIQVPFFYLVFKAKVSNTLEGFIYTDRGCCSDGGCRAVLGRAGCGLREDWGDSLRGDDANLGDA